MLTRCNFWGHSVDYKLCNYCIVTADECHSVSRSNGTKLKTLLIKIDCV